MALDWRPAQYGRDLKGYDEEGQEVASVTYSDLRPAFPESDPYWSGWLRSAVRVPGQHPTAEAAMEATDRMWEAQERKARK